jgi:isopentenyl-diphosphate delta-isomerase
MDADRVVLLDEEGQPIGTELKRRVHSADTPLHLAFSCHVVDSEGRVLVSRRALTKSTWPGVWTNSFCGHPRPGEAIVEAVHRRAEHELGLEIADVELVIPDFRYRAVDDSGIVEFEVCPVFTARAVSEPRLRADEVAAIEWVAPRDLATAIGAAPWAFSPWLVLHAPRLPLLAQGALA